MSTVEEAEKAVEMFNRYVSCLFSINHVTLLFSGFLWVGGGEVKQRMKMIL